VTGARPFTYGQLLNEALLELNQALSGRVRFDRPSEAITAAQARVRIYHTIARAADTCAAGLGPVADPAAPLRETDRRNAARLHADLSASAIGTQHVLDLPAEPGPRQSVAGRLSRVADAAGLAWDLLATQLPPHGATAARRGHPAGGLNARSVLTDAALLARGMASLDVRLEPAMSMVAVDPATPNNIGRALQQVAEDCEAVTLLGVPAYTGQILHQPTNPAAAARQALNALTAPSAPMRVVRLTSEQQAVAAAEAYLAWLMRGGGDLTVPDLLSLAATASRLTRLVARARGTSVEPHPAGRDAVGAWREAYQATRRLRSIHPRPAGWRQAVRLAAWADEQLRAAQPPPRRSATVTEIADLLPALAEAGQASLRRLHSGRRLYAPAPGGSRYLYAPAGGTHVRTVLRTFELARTSSAALAQPAPAVALPDTPGRSAISSPGRPPHPAVDRIRTASEPAPTAAPFGSLPPRPAFEIADTLGLD